MDIYVCIFSDYLSPHRHTVQRQLSRLYSEHKRLLIKNMSTVPWIAATCDFWSDKRLYSYICLTGHYVTPSFHLISKIIAFSYFPQRHYSTNISNVIQDKLKELKIYEKITTITTDGAANMVKSFETLRPEIERVYCKCIWKTSSVILYHVYRYCSSTPPDTV